MLIVYGTESGTAELVAEEIAELEIGGETPEVQDLGDTDPEQLRTVDRLVVICSTYGEGDLPATAEPFMERLRAEQPDLTGVRFFAYGLGDSFYHQTYNGGIETMSAELAALGAQRIGDIGTYDTSGGDDPVEAASEWFTAVMSDAASLAEAGTQHTAETPRRNS